VAGVAFTVFLLDGDPPRGVATQLDIALDVFSTEMWIGHLAAWISALVSVGAYALLPRTGNPGRERDIRKMPLHQRDAPLEILESGNELGLFAIGCGFSHEVGPFVVSIRLDTLRSRPLRCQAHLTRRRRRRTCRHMTKP
jgi:hypothetical protein